MNSLAKLLSVILMTASALNGCAANSGRLVFEPDAQDERTATEQQMEAANRCELVFEPDVQDVSAVTEQQMRAAESVIRARLDSINEKEATVSRQGKYGIRVEIPNTEDPHAVVELIGQTAHLTFVNAMGEVVMDGSSDNVKSATLQLGPVTQNGNNEYYVSLELTSAGQAAFKTATEEAVSLTSSGMNYIAILLDDTLVSAPMVKEVIDSDSCKITGGFTRESAKNLADIINSRSLPFKLKLVE